MADAAASFSRLSFRRAASPSPLRLPSLPPRCLRLSFAVVALHKRNPKRLKYASQRQFTVCSTSIVLPVLHFGTFPC